MVGCGAIGFLSPIGAFLASQHLVIIFPIWWVTTWPVEFLVATRETALALPVPPAPALPPLPLSFHVMGPSVPGFFVTWSRSSLVLSSFLLPRSSIVRMVTLFPCTSSIYGSGCFLEGRR